MLLTIGPDNATGFRKHLEELASCVTDAKFMIVKESGCDTTIKEILKYKPDLTIIGGRNWILRNKNILDKIPGKIGILFCSPLAQAEISNQEINNLIQYLSWLEHDKIDYLFVGSKELAGRFSNKKIIYLPAPFLKEINSYKGKKCPSKKIVSLLNDKAVHKNILNSLAAVSLSKNVEEFVVNGLPKGYRLLSQRFGLKNKLKNVGFLSKKSYYNLIKKSKLMLNISFSEGFSYGVLEGLYSGTPVLISNALPWFYHKLLVVKNQSDHKEIATKIDKVLNLSKRHYKTLSEECRNIAEKTIARNNRIAKRTLKIILGNL